VKRWYVAQTQAHAEERARLNLERQGFRTYLPRYRRERRHARRREIVKAPLFPGYIFVELDLDLERWRSINSTFGVARLVCHGEQPAAVPAGIVEEITARAGADGLVKLQPPPLRKGDALRIVSGALAECSGLFERMADGDRVILLLDLLGRKVQVQAPLTAVSAS
jgi:transcriptional antiterminator RfaH